MSDANYDMQKEYQIIDACRKKLPTHFLKIEDIDVGKGRPIPIGLFSCIGCSQPINHHQMAFSGLCGNCDLGKEQPDWLIVKPDEFKDIELTLTRQTDMKTIQRVHARVKENLKILFFLKEKYEDVLKEIKENEEYQKSGMML